ncbi:hypothetical protein, partial [Glaesserella parasuis]|uniref:hypothetical protein n=1 Tax=Glaesserella parasuis TaxID=738 RepID=UPI003853BBB6
CQGVKLFFVHNKIPVSECIISETGIYTNCGRGSLKYSLATILSTMPNNWGVFTLISPSLLQ